jgi:hypothetical protein
MKILWTIIFLLLIGCFGGRQFKDEIVITSVDPDEFKLTSKYWFFVGDNWIKYYFIDKYGLYEVGDTIFVSSLRKKN